MELCGNRGESDMKQGGPILAAMLSGVCAAACGPKVLVPPRLDLAPYHRIGLVTFTMENAKGDLNLFATESFADEVFASQRGIELLELGQMEEILAETGRDRFDPRAAMALGDEYEIPAVFVGHLKVSDVRPRASISRFPSVEAVVSVEMTVRLLSTESGATLWSNSARATESVGGIALTAGDVIFSAEDPNAAYGRLVEVLIEELTQDFRPTRR